MRSYSLIALAAIVAGGLAGWLALRGSDGEPDFRGSSPPPGNVLPSFELRDHEGALLRRADLDGKVALVTFLESKCRAACPVIAAAVARGLDLIPEDERTSIVAVAISVHPRDDTPASVRAFLHRHRADGKLRYLVGSERELRPVWRAFQVLPAVDTGNADIHSAPVRVYDPGGEWVSTLHSGVDLTPDNLAHDAREALE